MNWLEIAQRVSLVSLLALQIGCGVRGDPLPPERPPELGRGRPTFKKATEKIEIKRESQREDEDED